MFHFRSQVVFIVLIAIVLSCGQNHKQTAKQPDYNSKEFRDKLIEANKMYVKRESDEIDQYVAHKGWQMTTTGTGLRYMIVKKGDGELAKPEQVAKVNYKITLLNGTICYSSDSTGAKEFKINQDNVESGLHEGVQYMHVGDKAKFILPSYLAHGLMGDENRIPPKASVIYDIELLSLR